MGERIDDIIVNVAIFAKELITLLFKPIVRFKHTTAFIGAVTLTVVCVPRGIAGGQNAKTLGLIGLLSLLTAVIIAAKAFTNLYHFNELEHVDHKAVPKSPSWFDEI